MASIATHSRQTLIPAGAHRVESFAAYTEIVQKFMRGNIRLGIVVGRPGLSKSYAFKGTSWDTPPHVIGTHASGFGLYQEIHRVSQAHVPRKEHGSENSGGSDGHCRPRLQASSPRV